MTYLGLRPGEKLYEEKLMAEEGLKKTRNELIHIGCPIPFEIETFLKELESLMDMAYTNAENIREKVAEVVTTYHPAGEHGSEKKGEVYERLLARLIILWFEVLFYSVISEIILKILFPNEVGVKDIVKAVVPVCSQQFWYFTAYFAMFWFIPVFNWIVHNLELKKFRYLIYALLTIFGFVPWVSEIFGTTAFGVAEGYTALWLSILYLVGAGIRVYGFSAFSLRKREHSASWFLNTALLSGGLIFLSKIVLTILTVKILEREFGTAQFYSYLSPLVVLEALLLLCFFSRLKIENGEFWIKVGKLTFGIYLVHQTRLFGHYVWPIFKGYIDETLLTNEECANAIDMGEFYRVPCDKRDLNYDKYFKDGDIERNTLTEFDSNNTKLLSVEQVKEKLLTLQYIQDALSNN